jgi:hypothetical protein
MTLSLFEVLAILENERPTALSLEEEQSVSLPPKSEKAKAIEAKLVHFHGTEEYHCWNAIFRNFYLTDGAKFVAKEASAYWLMDAIASWQTISKVEKEEFQFWQLDVNREKGSAQLICTNGNSALLACQDIPYTDFPLDNIELYCCLTSLDGTTFCRVILLPSEY